MKISAAQKLKNRALFLEAAVDVITENGVKNATMKAIAARAGLSEPTIYNYFPSKESLLYGYFQWRLNQVLIELEASADFRSSPLTEQIQAVLERQLELFANEREFVRMAFEAVFVSSLAGSLTDLAAQRNTYVQFVTRSIEAAQAVGEIPRSPFSHFFAGLAWDFHVAIVHYWLRDDSVGFTNTTQLIDKTLLLAREILKGEVMSRGLDLVQFLIRQHLFSSLHMLSDFTPQMRFEKECFYKRTKQAGEAAKKEKRHGKKVK
jgi:AcrR family transcriptional regulator